MNIDEILKAIRKELNISQETLARDLSVSFTTLNQIGRASCRERV